MLVKINDELSINPVLVASYGLDHHFYMNGSSTYLVITMADGKQHRVEHGHGIDVFAIEKCIEAANQL